MMNIKKKIIALISTCLLITVALFGTKCAFEEHLVFMEDATPVCFADSYWQMNAIISESGNVYVRGALLSDDTTYGIPNVNEYKAQFQSLNFEKTDRFVQIYSTGDARTVMLSNNGGVIITDNNEVFVFCELENYRLPTFLCEDATHATLDGTKVYLLNDKGSFGYIDLSLPDDRIQVLEGIKSFCITDQDHSVWILNDKHELWVFMGGDLSAPPVMCNTEVMDFDAASTTSYSSSEAHYRIGIVKLDGTVSVYDDWGLPSSNSTGTFTLLSVDHAPDITVYSHGVVVLDQEGNARAFGYDLLSDRIYNGEVIIQNVCAVSAGALSINFVTKDGHHVYAGSLPSSAFVELEELIQ